MGQNKVPAGIKKVAVICLLKSGNQWLLLKRKNPPNQGLFTPVGGKLDAYESPENAAIREISEETGIIVNKVNYCGLLVETSPIDYNWTSFIYLSEVEYLSPPDCNEGELFWIKNEDLSTISMPETDIHIYKYVIENKKFNFFVEFNDKMEILSFVETITNKKLR